MVRLIKRIEIMLRMHDHEQIAYGSPKFKLFTGGDTLEDITNEALQPGGRLACETCTKKVALTSKSLHCRTCRYLIERT